MRFNAKMCAHSILVSVILTFMFSFRGPLEIEVSSIECPMQAEITLDDYLPVKSRKDQNSSFVFRIPNYEINCTNIHEIKMDSFLGHGVSKRCYGGWYKGRRVAVKMATLNELYSRECIDDGLDATKPDHVCYRLSNMKLMKEILMVQQFRHPGLMRMLGFCLRSEETTDITLEKHGLVAVYEFAMPLIPQTLIKWTLRTRLEKAVELYDLFDYFEYSPIGSIQFPDLKLSHFLWVDNRIKVHDFDDATIKEPTCQVTSDCEYETECLNGHCHNYNARMNLAKLDYEFSRYFYPEMYFEAVPELKTLSEALHSNTATAYDLGRDTANLLRRLPQIEAEKGPFNRTQYFDFLQPKVHDNQQ